MQVSSSDMLGDIIGRYAPLMADADEDMKSLWKDSVILGKEIVYLRTGMDDELGRGLLATLSEAEREELREADRIIGDNLFDYHFQPIVTATDGEIYSYEGLMRPRSELVSQPVQILKYASLRNRLSEVERSTFLNILNLIDRNRSYFHGKKVFINSIPKTVLTDDDRKNIRDLITQYHNTVVVELTEKAQLDDEELAEFKDRFRILNVQTAIDDYGTGYSNVQNLLRYMPDYVKIDRSLLSGMQDDPKKRHFVREIIDYCHINGMMALAEGVETKEELRSVILLGADLIQGFYTAKPELIPVETIPYEIRQEIRNYAHERQEGICSRIYTIDSGETVSLDRLIKNETSCILIGRDGDCTVLGQPKLDAEIAIETGDNIKAELTLDNARLFNRSKHPCIEIGRGCEITLVLKGDNRLSMGGIRVPEDSTLYIKGDGNLNISLDSDEYFGIGNDLYSAAGDIILEGSGTLKIDANGKIGTCIGSGLAGNIELKGGRYEFEINSDTAVGIGSLYRDMKIPIEHSDINIELSTIKGIAIGSLGSNIETYISNTSIKLYLSGKETVGIGTISGVQSVVDICEASLIMNTHSDRCTGVGSLDGLTSLRIERAALRLYAKGDSILPFGGFSSETDLKFVDADVTAKIMSAVKLSDYLPSERIDIIYGRIRIVLNGMDYELKD